MNPSGEVYRTITGCRLCGSEDLELALDLGNLCLSDFLSADAPDPPRVPLRLAVCRKCEFAQLLETTRPDQLYRYFWYRSGTNQTMRDEMARLAGLAGRFDKAGPGRTWVDIGANDGTLLSFAPDNVRRIAFEPALNLSGDCAKHADLVVSNYFRSGLISDQADVVFSAAMFYDLDDPAQFIEDVRKTLKSDGIWINQLSSTRLMLSAGAFDNICHEHLGYYTVRVLTKLYDQHGMEIVSVEHNDVNGGSMCVIARPKSKYLLYPQSLDNALWTERQMKVEDYVEFGHKVVRWRMLAAERLAKLVESGQKLHVYGASTKGNTLLQYLGAGTSIFSAAADKSSWKWWKVTAGTRIPIVSEEDSRAQRPDAYFVLPWAFRKEFVEREAQYIADGGRLIFPLPDWQEVAQ